MELSQIIQIISIIGQFLAKIGFFAVCIYYGNIALKGWRGKKNPIITIIGIILLGIISFFGGIILKSMFGLNFILAEYLTGLIVALISMFLLSMISTGFEVKNNYATKMDLSAIMNDLKELKIQVAKITKALEDEKITPKELSEDDIKNKLKESLEAKGLKKLSIVSLTKHIDYWTAKLSGGKEAIIDAYTGSINEIKESKNFFEIIYKKPFFTIGAILSIIFLIFLSTNISQETINSFNEIFDYSFLIKAPLPVGCISASELLESLNKSDINPAPGINALLLNQTVFEKTGTYLILDKTKTAKNFTITLSYESPISDIASEITENPTENIYKLRVCVLKNNYEACECIGEKQTDPAFTAPYLIKLDLINEVILGIIQSLFESSIGGIFGQ